VEVEANRKGEGRNVSLKDDTSSHVKEHQKLASANRQFLPTRQKKRGGARVEVKVLREKKQGRLRKDRFRSRRPDRYRGLGCKRKRRSAGPHCVNLGRVGRATSYRKVLA